MVKAGGVKAATPFDDKLMRRIIILERGNRRFEVTRVGKAVSANRAAVRQGEFGPVILADIAARHIRIGADLGHHAPRQYGDMPGWHNHPAHFGKNVQRAAFRDNQHFSIGIQQYAIGHVFIKSVKASSHAKMLTRIASLHSASEIIDEHPEIDRERRDRFYAIIYEESQHLSELGDAMASYFDNAAWARRTLTPMDEVDAIKAAYAGHANSEIVTHPGASHNFAMPYKEGYVPEVAKASRDAVLKCFQSM